LQIFSAAGFGDTMFSSDTTEVYMVDYYGHKWYCTLKLDHSQHRYCKLGALTAGKNNFIFITFVGILI
jgi:hypothetical protein